MRNDGGASAVEYALLIAGVAAFLVTTVFLFGNFVGDIFIDSCTDITSQTGPIDYDCVP